MTYKIAFSNHKGGTGKSQTVVQTAAALARAGKNVLVVDMDPQANATRRLGIEWSDQAVATSVSEAIKANVPGAGQAAVMPCTWEQEEGRRIDVLPARRDLIARDGEASELGNVLRLAVALEGWSDYYNFILIDTRPDLGHLVEMAWAAADTVVLVVAANFDSVDGAITVRDDIAKKAKFLYNPNLAVGGVIVTRVRGTAEDKFQIEGINNAFGDTVWDLTTSKPLGDYEVEQTPSAIPEWTRLAEADSAACSVSAWTDARGRTCTAIFDQIAKHITALVPEPVMA